MTTQDPASQQVYEVESFNKNIARRSKYFHQFLF